VEAQTARERAAEMLARLAIPERLWPLPPATFSGGEQQRINIARGLVAKHPVLLLDEPTASLDQSNRAAVIDFIRHRKRTGAALVGIFHDEDVKRQIGDRCIEVSRFRG
jgi:alpha-D-ribose 1-methylphosphonate 5-triphosphate synthase subunit PhnL